MIVALLMACGIALAAPSLAHEVHVGARAQHHHHYRSHHHNCHHHHCAHRHHHHHDHHHRYSRDELTRKPIYAFDHHVRAKCRTTIVKRHGMTKKIRRCH